ncbi:MAG: SAM-dependent methyltransferase [Phycisphaerae bacterium]|nr:MAG: SAM-dependent methyltransferase [Phycisphaerae bacterium]
MPTPRATLTPEYQRDWPAYFDSVQGQPPRDTLVRALDAFERDDATAPKPVWRVAVDIGCGEGRDVREMMRRAGSTRWKVMAADLSGEGLERLHRTLREAPGTEYLLTATPMEELPTRYPNGVRVGGTERLHRHVDLANASFALPFCREDAFPALWAWIVNLLKPGGRFAGQLFGNRDEWASVNPRRHHTREQALALLDGFEVEHFDEVEKEGSDAMGGSKRHHVFHIVARKLGGSPGTTG